MKIAIATNGNSLKDEVALHFGRAKNFLIFDTETKCFEVFENPEIKGKELPPDFLAKKSVNCVITFSLGSRAFEKFQNYKIKVFKAIQGSILNNLKALEENQLKNLTEEDIF
ncbi:MAG: NifB/NifX family molybdenum-iron cluster-binding protein [Candidatus Nanoarchaeia archaeon]